MATWDSWKFKGILFSIGDVRVFSGINWLVGDDRALKKPECLR
jgi:hypothetical protein